MAGFPKSVRARLTMWYSAMLAIPLVAFAIVSYVAFSRTLTSRTDGFLVDALSAFGNELQAERRQTASAEAAVRTTVREVRFRDLDILVLGQGGTLVAESRSQPAGRSPSDSTSIPALSGIMEELETRRDEEEWVSTLAWQGREYRVRAEPLNLEGREFVVIGAYPLAEVEDTLARIRRLFVILIPLLIIAAGTGGWLLARRSFRPVSAMAARAGEISATTLHERLPVVADDELGALARVLNDLLDRLERSFEQQRQFVADASHELRSPTAVLRSETDITLAREHRSEEEYRESMTVIQAAARRLTRVVDDLFLLARVDGGQPVMIPALVYLDDVVGETVRVARPIAEKDDVRIEVRGELEKPVRGDADLLGRLLLNLVDNGIRHSPPGGKVSVGLGAQGELAEIRVVDQGPGIPVEVQGRIFERFFQVDTARTGNRAALTSGAGLGLAIGRRIADMHGGRLELAGSRPGRTEFLLTLPLTDRLDAVAR